MRTRFCLRNRTSPSKLTRLAGVCAVGLALITTANAIDDIAAFEGTGASESPAVFATASLAPTIALATALSAPSDDDIAALKRALAHYDSGRISDGDREAEKLSHASARLAAEWAAVRSGAPAIRFQRVLAFMEKHGDWPALQPLQKRAEEALSAQRPGTDVTLAYFARFAPVSAAGRVAQASALDSTGQRDEALAIIRSVWRDDPMSADLERRVLAAFGDRLVTNDHRNRMEMLLFRGATEAALRNAQRAGNDHVRLAQARIALNRKSGGAKAAIDAVPASLHRDTSYLFAKAQWLRRSQEAGEAARLIAGMTRDARILVDGDEWWVERRLIARQLLDKGEPQTAYEVAAGHGAEKASARIEAEWHAGWIALRHLDRPAVALKHFENAAALAETPISIARTAYWQGRAREAMGETDAARTDYSRAATQHVAFYGQLARARLGLKEMPLSEIDATRAPDTPALRVLAAIVRTGDSGTTRTLALDLTRTVEDAPTMARVAALSAGVTDVRFQVSIGKLALQRGLPMERVAFPTGGMPAFSLLNHRVERVMSFAIARQESAFDARAVSHAGARGLMQMMLPTARETARRFGVAFDAGRLTSDPAYNATLGSAHLADLLRDWRGSYILTFAAYNAGSGNVRDWIEAYGDPRNPDVDPIDWIERIPFTETRNYVQRVMENLQVYRALIEQQPNILVASDLRRGARVTTFAGEAPHLLAEAQP